MKDVGLFIFCFVATYLFFAGFQSFAEWDLSFFDPQVWNKGTRAFAVFAAIAAYGFSVLHAALTR